MSNFILKSNSISKTFNQNSESCDILKNINYMFEQNKFYSIIGQSGKGKTTFLNILSGIDVPTKGTIIFNNSDINKFTSVQKDKYLNIDIGIVYQEPFLIKELNILENIMIKGLIAKINYEDCEQKAFSLLKKIGLENKALSFSYSLSVGQQQRVAILRSLFNDPKFLIADEPTANLDQKTKNEIMDLLFQYKNENNMGIIIATHDKEVIKLSDGILDLN